MNHNNDQLAFSKEIRVQDFMILLRFRRYGGIEGSFILSEKRIKDVFEISNGIFLNEEHKLSFSFCVDWHRKKKGAVSTYFSGYFPNEKEEDFFIDWLTVYENAGAQLTFTKNGKFSSSNMNLLSDNLPFPSKHIDHFSFD